LCVWNSVSLSLPTFSSLPIPLTFSTLSLSQPSVFLNPLSFSTHCLSQPSLFLNPLSFSTLCLSQPSLFLYPLSFSNLSLSQPSVFFNPLIPFSLCVSPFILLNIFYPFPNLPIPSHPCQPFLFPLSPFLCPLLPHFSISSHIPDPPLCVISPSPLFYLVSKSVCVCKGSALLEMMKEESETHTHTERERERERERVDSFDVEKVVQDIKS